jgi:fermentation-respiration switch protein FrsA (DUF1100 family)
MNKVNFLSRNGENITISAVLNVPGEFDESKNYPAVVVSHPGGGVKEQTAARAAGSKWMSDDLTKRAVSENKSVHVVEGANHMTSTMFRSMSTNRSMSSAGLSSPISDQSHPRRNQRPPSPLRGIGK